MRGRRVERVPLDVRTSVTAAVEGASHRPRQQAAPLYRELARRSPALVVGGASCPSASGRSTSTVSIRTSASSSRSSSKRCSAATCGPAGVCSTLRGLGDDARPVRSSRATTPSGVDVAAFNCLLMRVKTARYDLFQLEKRAPRRARPARPFAAARPRGYRRASGTHRSAAAELLHFRSLVDDYEHADVLRVVLARAARSARLTTHFDLDFPRTPQREPYWCHKHRRTCAPVAGGRTSSSVALPPRHARADQGVPAGPTPGSRRRDRARGLRATSRSRGRSTRSSRRRRTRG